MPLILPRSSILLVPRAASTWVRQAVRNGGISYREFGPKHSTALPADAPGFKFCLIRLPAPWVRSRWALGPWEDELSQFWDVDPEVFRSRLTEPMVQMYFAKYTAGCQFVGHAENAADDLVAALRQAGEDFDEVALRDTPRINESPPDNLPVGEFFWKLRRDDLSALPDDMIANLPIQLYPKLAKDRLAKLPTEILAPLVNRLTISALQAAGASIRGGAAPV